MANAVPPADLPTDLKARLKDFHQSLILSDWTPDLASNVGSARWFRGLGTMLALTAVALAFWPSFEPVRAAPILVVNDSIRDEYGSQMVMPLALGGDSGRRMHATDAVLALKANPERPEIEMVATLGQGDSFGRVLERAGIGGADAARAASLVSAVVPLGDISPGTRFDILLGRRTSPRSPRPLERVAFRARFDMNVEIARSGGGLIIKQMPIAVNSTPLRIRAQVGSSLYRSARAAGAPGNAVQAYLRALGSHMSVSSDVRPTDTIDLVVEYRRAATGEVQVGELLYAGLERGGKPKAQLVRWTSGGRTQFFEASGVGQQTGGMTKPTNGPITSQYGMRRHPILGYKRMHSGIDFGGGYGAPIYAVSDGRVVFAGRNGGYGNYVRLSHGGDLATGYAHMSRFAVSSGQSVRRGQIIGYIGSTGLSTGPHLHYELYRSGRPVNPNSVRFMSRALLEGEELARFRARLASLKAISPGAALAAPATKAEKAPEPKREIDRLK